VSEAPSTECVPAGDQGHADGGQSDLDEQLDPVDPAGAADADGGGEQRPDDGGDDVPLMSLDPDAQVGLGWSCGAGDWRSRSIS
jgi:hypothetical protein